MMTVRDRFRHLWRDERGFIGTAAALAIGLGSAGASAASGMYGAKVAGRENRRAIEAQERESVRQSQIDQQRWSDYVRIHEPIWNTGGDVLRSLTRLAGVRPSPGSGTHMAMPARPPGSVGVAAPVPPSVGGAVVPSGAQSLAALGSRSSSPWPTARASYPTMAIPSTPAVNPLRSMMDLYSMAQMFTRPDAAAAGGAT